MPSRKIRTRKPRWFLIPVRVVAMTVLLTLLSFAITLFLGILGTIVAAALRGIHPNMSYAYRFIAAPVAAIVGPIVFVSAIVMEVRHYRQTKALAEIERLTR